ncbi:MAG: nitroreductase [Burkholderiaceae bacterium]
MNPAEPLARPAPALQALLARRSVSPKRLGAPGPTSAQLGEIVRAGLRAPDHGGLVPWRVIEFAAGDRTALADLFAQEKLRRDPLASADDVERARAHATRAPALLAFVVSIRAGVTVPVHEQWLAAGAALGNMLDAVHALGFGGIVLSGDRCSDPVLTRELGLRETAEQLAGFISVGSIVKLPPAAPHKELATVWSRWPGALARQRAADPSS